MVNLTMLLFIIILICDNRTLIDEFKKRLMTPILTNFLQSYAKLKGASSRSTNAQKLKREEIMPQMNEKTTNLQ